MAKKPMTADRDVLNQAENSTEAIRSLQPETPLLQAVGYFREYYPGFHLDRETVARLAGLGVEVDCDFYFDGQNDGGKRSDQ